MGTLRASAGWCAPGPAHGEFSYLRVESPRSVEVEVEVPKTPTWWTASSGNRYPVAVIEPDFPWPLRAPTPRQRPHVTREMRIRWAAEDVWLRRQLALCVE